MNRAVKIALIAGVAVAAAFATVIVGPVLYIIVANSYAGFVMSVTPDSAFEEEFAQIPEVRLFVSEYPDHSKSHTGDFLGWKVIIYSSNGEPEIAMYVKKSLLHEGVRISAGCDYGAQEFVFDVPQEEVTDLIARGCGDA